MASLPIGEQVEWSVSLYSSSAIYFKQRPPLDLIEKFMGHPSFVLRNGNDFLKTRPSLPNGFIFELSGHIYPSLCQKTAFIELVAILRDFHNIRLREASEKGARTIFKMNVSTNSSQRYWELYAEIVISSKYPLLIRSLFARLIKLNEFSISTQGNVKKSQLEVHYTEEEFRFNFRTGVKEMKRHFFHKALNVVAAILDK